MTKLKIRYILITGLAFSLSSCSIFQNKPVSDGWTESNIYSKVVYNKLTEVKEKNDTKIYGNIKRDDNENVGLVLFFKNINNKKAIGFQTDFDGNYSTSLESGKYDLVFRDKILLRDIIVEKGDQRRIDFELIIGPETTISVEYKNQRAWRKAQREKKRKAQRNDGG